MSVTKTKSKIIPEAEHRLRNLSLERLIVANDFLAYLEDRESEEATKELLKLTGFEVAFHNASQQAEKGELINLNTIRRNV